MRECQASVVKGVNFEILTKKAMQVVFDEQMALKNAAKRVVRRRNETDKNTVLILKVLFNGGKMGFQLCNRLFDSFNVSHLRSTIPWRGEGRARNYPGRVAIEYRRDYRSG